MLAQLKNQLTFHIIHGMSQIEEDFRLKNLLTQLESLTNKNKVLGSIYQDLSLILQEENKDKKIALLQCLSKINGVLYVQGKSGISLENELEETIAFDKARREPLSWKYSEIAPLILALTKKDKNRFQTIEWYLANKPLIFVDFRIIQALVRGMSDKSFDIRQYCSHILLELGKKERDYSTSSSFVYYYVTKGNPLPTVEPAILVSKLKKDFDMNGKSDMVERLRLIGELEKDKGNEWYHSLLKSTKKEIRGMAILNLKYSQDNIPFLLQLLENKKEKNVAEIVQTLSELKYDDLEFWRNIVKEKIDYTVYLETYEGEDFLDIYIENLKYYIERCIKNKKSIKFSYLNELYRNETSDKLIDFYIWIYDYLENSDEKKQFLYYLELSFIRKLYLNETSKMYEVMEHLSQSDKKECLGIYLFHDCLHLSIEEVINKWKQYSDLIEEKITIHSLLIYLKEMKIELSEKEKWEECYQNFCYYALRMMIEYDIYHSRSKLLLEEILKVIDIKDDTHLQVKLGQYCYRSCISLLENKYGCYYSFEYFCYYAKLIHTLGYGSYIFNMPIEFTKDLSRTMYAKDRGITYSGYSARIFNIFIFLCEYYKKEELEQLKEKVLELYFETEFDPENFYDLERTLNNILNH